MSDLATFLLERIAEDEATTQAAAAHQGAHWFDEEGVVSSDTAPTGAPGHSLGMYAPDGRWMLWDCEGAASLGVHATTSAHFARWDPARVLAECEAKRRIVALDRDPSWDLPTEVLRLLALPYASHDGYRDEWRP